MNKPIHIYNHQYLDSDQTWIFILQDQFYEFERSGLIDEADIINVVAIGDSTQLELVKQTLTRYSKINLIPCEKNELVQDERLTLNQIWFDSQHLDAYVLYTHNKGSTAWKKFFEPNPIFYHNYYHWRKYCEWGVIERWRDCVLALGANDIVGVNFNSGPCPHFSGNMWWSTSKYISGLDNIYKSAWWKLHQDKFDHDRMISEMWACHNAKNIGSLHDPGPELRWPNHGVYSVAYTRSNYVKKGA